MRKLYFSPQKENKNELAWNIVYWLPKSPCFEFFGGGKYGLFEPKSWWKFDIDCWKVLVLNLSGMGNTVFFWDKELVERWYLLITEVFLFWTFQGWKMRSFWGKKLMERWYLLVTEKFLFWTFPWWEIRSFLRQKVNGKMMFTDYWKVLILGYRKILVLSFSVMGNAVFF